MVDPHQQGRKKDSADLALAYYDFFPTLSSPPHNIAVYAFDQRGWGRSVNKPTEKGNTGPTSLVIADIHDFVLHVASLPEAKGRPLFLMGHSMGGNESLYYLLSDPAAFSNRPPIAGLLLEAPYIELDPSEQPSFLKVFAGKLAAFLLPTTQLKQKLDSTYLSHAAKVREDWVNDPLCHDTGTLEGLKGLLQRAGDLSSMSHGHQIAGLHPTLPCPVWLGHGTSDRVVSASAAKRLFDVLAAPEGDKVYQAYPDAYHKLHAEPDGVGQKFTNDVAGWILSHANQKTAEIPVSVKQ
ncbi:uncharacterized protein A1O9_05018 [Exophiala aquamarina CBS 119918]|uniref:Serine aminopeptidase S33 domain-containing protein n=1 Tax=Exophiala aquamarina CBS 119918 TaxID=1182545 RepID=A0A072PLE8_9EURO|nr:uncharacterized protein A1O9_05018 [Exophiala aquamarina CBS 119918]KEF60168.1 hypothetical protein A1O9_05018 [Exophiala aquamarina CBS 119918]